MVEEEGRAEWPLLLPTLTPTAGRRPTAPLVCLRSCPHICRRPTSAIGVLQWWLRYRKALQPPEVVTGAAATAAEAQAAAAGGGMFPPNIDHIHDAFAMLGPETLRAINPRVYAARNDCRSLLVEGLGGEVGGGGEGRREAWLAGRLFPPTFHHALCPQLLSLQGGNLSHAGWPRAPGRHAAAGPQDAHSGQHAAGAAVHVSRQ